MKEKITRWFKQGLWTASMVYAAVEKGVLSETEAKEIVGENR